MATDNEGPWIQSDSISDCSEEMDCNSARRPLQSSSPASRKRSSDPATMTGDFLCKPRSDGEQNADTADKVRSVAVTG